jgi:hypothetical protein
MSTTEMQRAPAVIKLPPLNGRLADSAATPAGYVATRTGLPKRLNCA